jgi:hypothetical protein
MYLWKYRVHFPAGAWRDFFLLTTASRPALGSTQPPIQWVPRVPNPKMRRPGCEANHSLTSSADFMNPWGDTSTHPYVLMAWNLVEALIFLTVTTFGGLNSCAMYVAEVNRSLYIYRINDVDLRINTLNSSASSPVFKNANDNCVYSFLTQSL